MRSSLLTSVVVIEFKITESYSSLDNDDDNDYYSNNIIIIIIIKCQYYDNQSPEDGSRVNSRNVLYIKYASDNGQCPT
jgi:hypothetical protein